MMELIKRYRWSAGKAIALLLMFFALPLRQHAQTDPADYEEIFVYLSVENIGFYEMDALFLDDKVYLPVNDMFQKLKIFTTHSFKFDTIQGYFGNAEAMYSINLAQNTIIFKSDTIKAKPGEMIANSYDLFVASSVLEKAFGLTLRFDFRSLTVFLSSDTELPVVKLLRQEKIRENLRQIKGEIKTDTVLRRKYHLLSGAVLDWELQNEFRAGTKPQWGINTALGAEILGGEFNMRSRYQVGIEFDIYNQSLRWRWVNNDRRVVRQVEASVMSSPLYSQVSSPMIGVGFTNAPTTYRKSYGTYVLHDKTNPGWEVELYINNVLIDYITADANGDFTFEIPLIYGNSEITLKKYGPWGEEEVNTQTIAIPYVFVPKHELEYQFYSGFTFDSLHQTFALARASYGLGRKATISGGYEYFGRNETNRHIPFVSASVVLMNNLMLNTSWLNGTYHQTALTYRLRSGLSLESQFRHYFDGQDAISSSATNDLQVGLNVPVLLFKKRSYFKSSYRIVESSQSLNSAAEASWSFFLKRFNIVAHSAVSFGNNTTTASGGINTSYSFKRQWVVFSQTTADFTNGKFIAARMQVQKRITSKIFGSIAGDYSFDTQNFSFTFNMHFDLGVMRSGHAATFSGNEWSNSSQFSGSIMPGGKYMPLSAFSRSMSGKSGIDIMVFLDINHNGLKDKSEPLLSNMPVSLSKGQRIAHGNDSVYRYISLEPYTLYIISLGESGMQNISWVPAWNTIAVYPEPNRIKKVYIPVFPMGEVSGSVTYSDGKGNRAAAGIMVEIVDDTGKTVATTLTEQDGYFSYMGLKPGKYTLQVNKDQLQKLKCSLSEMPATFTIRESAQGDFVDDMNFSLRKSD